jgi:carboxyl-terminal processing protease
LYNLITKYIIFDYATKYAVAHPLIGPAETFRLSDEDYNDFVAFTGKKGFEYITVAEKELETMKKAAIYENSWNDIESLYNSMKVAIATHKKHELIENKEDISAILQQEIVSRYYYQKGRIISTLSDDKELKSATDVLKNQVSYTSILDGTYIKADNQAKSLKSNN